MTHPFENIFTAPPRPNGLRWCFQSKTHYVTKVWNILNLKGYQNCTSGPKTTAILLHRLTWPLDGVALENVCTCSLCTRCVLYSFDFCQGTYFWSLQWVINVWQQLTCISVFLSQFTDSSKWQSSGHKMTNLTFFLNTNNCYMTRFIVTKNPP